ncbi:Uncharacterized protein APZ42_029085 [Daphnia magna]|uniref:Uncharacterized protein n=1 Tax=Daphnia magna TaxID=35525 RepID=A0A164PXT4_9CRUS|nr:Uncharacterized protein APZ42_029085 [Daphnia magna]
MGSVISVWPECSHPGLYGLIKNSCVKIKKASPSSSEIILFFGETKQTFFFLRD